MYIPEFFREGDHEVLLDAVESIAFATLISWEPEPIVTHLPLALERGGTGGDRLLGHMARSNPHWRRFDGRSSALAVFHGPHAYVSPAWYRDPPHIPTWNYAVIHAYGRPRKVEGLGARAILDSLIRRHEAPREAFGTVRVPESLLQDELRHIAAFEIPIDQLTGKFKLGQNRSEADREATLAGLEREGGVAGNELARFAREYYRRRPVDDPAIGDPGNPDPAIGDSRAETPKNNNRPEPGVIPWEAAEDGAPGAP